MKKTLILKVNPQNPESDKIHKAVKIIQSGGLVAFPTETVYGLGADALNEKAVLALFEAKKRPLDNPPIVHIADPKEVYRLTEKVPKKAEVLMKSFWPRPLTLIFKHSKIIPQATTAGLDTVALRMPRHSVALALIKESNTPIAAPSANLSGKPSPTCAQHVLDDLSGRIDVVLDGGSTLVGVESTVIDLSVEPPLLLRPGGTPFEALKKVLRDLELHPYIYAQKELVVEKAQSPGMKHKHYAPNAQMVLVEGEVDAVIKKVQALVKDYKLLGFKVGVLATDETKAAYNADVIKSMGSRKNLENVAQKLFGLLREFNSESVDVIVAEGVPNSGLGLAVLNRLRKASAYNVIKA